MCHIAGLCSDYQITERLAYAYFRILALCIPSDCHYFPNFEKNKDGIE